MVWRDLLRGLGVAAAMMGTASAEQLPITAYTTADGLAHERVTCIVSDSRRFLWFCTADGLSRFDGQEFTTYGAAHGFATPGSTTSSKPRVACTGWRPTVEVSSDQPCHAQPSHARRRTPRRRSTRAGSSSRFTAFRFGDDPQTNRVNVLYEDRGGRLWAGTDGGLFRSRRQDVTPGVSTRAAGFPRASRSWRATIWAIVEDREGGLWIGTSWGLVRRLRDGRMIHTAVQPAARCGPCAGVAHRSRKPSLDWPRYGSSLCSVPQDEPGRVSNLIRPSRESQAIRKVKLPAIAGAAARYTTQDGVSGGMVRALLQSSDGHVWIATLDGVTQFDGERFRAFTKAHGIPGATSLAEDRHGNIWIGTQPMAR